jgi:DnaA family protein
MAEQLVLDLARVEPPTFRNFVAGPNREAVAALGRLAEEVLPETGILLWGADGVGKTHLLRGIVAAAAPLRPAFFCAKPADVPMEPDRLPASSLVAIDDVDSATPEDQARMFTLCNALAAHGGQWVAAAHAPPARMALRDDLRTRLALGLVFEVLPLSDADKPQALATYARERGFRLGDDVIGYLLAHGRRDMRSLVATLGALDRHSLATRRVVTVALLREWLQRDLRL